jgi:hypothetical protein
MKIVSTALVGTVLAGCVGSPVAALAMASEQDPAAKATSSHFSNASVRVTNWSATDGSCRTLRLAHGSSCGCPLCGQSRS